MDKSKLKEIVQTMSEEERSELGQLLLESVLERWSEEEEAGTEIDEAKSLGGFDVIVDEGEDDPPK